jgi:hypothetical protein
MFFSFVMSLITLAIHVPISRISASFIPREVTAGVPMRSPLVTNGLLVSFGMVFLLTVIAAFPSAFSASRPGDALVREVEEHKVVIGTPGNEPEAVVHQGLGKDLCIFDNLFIVFLK